MKILVFVYNSPRGYYATISGGWWIAYATTPEKASQRVINIFKREIEFHGTFKTIRKDKPMEEKTEYQLNPMITRDVLIQYEFIRQSSAHNMFDLYGVQNTANQLGFYDLALLEKDQYLELIGHFSAYMREFDIPQDETINKLVQEMREQQDEFEQEIFVLGLNNPLSDTDAVRLLTKCLIRAGIPNPESEAKKIVEKRKKSDEK